jgi:hypothetical protein
MSACGAYRTIRRILENMAELNADQEYSDSDTDDERGDSGVSRVAQAHKQDRHGADPDCWPCDVFAATALFCAGIDCYS